MARTIDTIHQSLITQKEDINELDGLTSNSKSAVWRLLFYVVAVGIWILENLWDQKELDLEAQAKTMPCGTPLWYIEQAKAFQYGDSAQWNGDQYGYLTIDESKQIVTHAAVNVEGSQVNIKVAKADPVDPILIPLTTAEKSALNGYLQQIKFVGTVIQVISEAADDLKAKFTIYIDPLKINDSDGSSVADASVFPVKDAIAGYLQSLDFGGTFRRAELIQAILQVNGVTNVGVGTLSARYSGNPYELIGDDYTAFAGHMALDDANTVINYVNI